MEEIRQRVIRHPVDESVVVENDYLAEQQSIQLVNFILGIVETILGLRFALQLFGANPDSSIVSFIYAISGPLMAPFRGMFRTTVADGTTFEWSTLAAMALYALIAYAIIRLIEVSTAPTERVYP